MQKHTFKQKIEILNGILNQYSKYFKYFDNAECYFSEFISHCAKPVKWKKNKFESLNKSKYKPFKHKNITFCIFLSQSQFYIRKNDDHKREPHIRDIDIVIKRYRSKLDYEINKHVKECMKNRVCKKIFRIPYHLYRLNML